MIRSAKEKALVLIDQRFKASQMNAEYCFPRVVHSRTSSSLNSSIDTVYNLHEQNKSKYYLNLQSSKPKAGNELSLSASSYL
jgi:hypothetical protein